MPIKELAQSATESLQNVDPKAIRVLGDVSFAAGFASIVTSIAIWGINRATDDRAHAERFGIFVGLWAPTFFILSNRLERYAERVEQGKLP
jgi:hypothetical protein